MENGFLNKIDGIADIIAQYEDEAYFENSICVLLVECGCFYFRELSTGNQIRIEYGGISRYDSEDFSEEQLVEMSRAISMAERYGFVI
ncbi:MAG: hypothetical protein ACRCZ9_01985, partial [Fusobacteriaceae bacterium]